MWNRTFRFAWVVAGACAVVLSAGPVDSGRAASRIIGGTPAPAGSWPAIVALVDNTQPTVSAGQFCGGTLIDPSWVLTAAHCITNGTGGVVGTTSLDVVAGITNLALDTGQRVSVAAIVRHPAYVPATFQNDVALLHLAAPVTLNATTATMEIISPIRPDLWDAGSPAEVAGWGNISTVANVFPNDLRQVTVPIQSDATCAASYGIDFFSASMFCAGPLAGGLDSCQGDSGGPLTVVDGTARVLTGAVSWGNGCALANFPGVYTRLDALRSFIFGPTGLNQSPPTAPVNVDASLASATSATVTWLPPTQSGRPVSGYRVRAVLGGIPGSPIFSSGLSTTLSGLVAGGDYTFTVDAAQSAGIGSQSGLVAPLAPLATSGPTVVGNPRTGQSLTATSAWKYLTGSQPTNQWQRCDVAGLNCVDIVGATAPTFALTATDVGSRIRVRVTATNNKGPSAVDSVTSGVVVAPVAPVNAVLPGTTGITQVGRVLQATAGSWVDANTFAFAWDACDAAGASCVAIPGAVGTTFTPTRAQIGQRLRVDVVATNPQGSTHAFSVPTTAIVPLPPALITPSVVSGTMTVGQTLTASAAVWVDADTTSLQWQLCDTAITSCGDLPGATGPSTTLVTSMVGQRLRVAMTATNVAGTATLFSAATGVVLDIPLLFSAFGKPAATQSAKGIVTVKFRLQTAPGAAVTVGVKNPKGTRVLVDAAKSRIDGKRPTRVNARTISAVAGPTGIVQIALVFTGHPTHAKKLGRLVIMGSARGQTVTVTPGFRARF
jgi:trypsin